MEERDRERQREEQRERYLKSVCKSKRHTVKKKERKTQGHLPEDERDGVIPGPVAVAMRQSLRPGVSNDTGGIKQKHATPVAKPEEPSVSLTEVRPSSLFPDRESYNIASPDVKEILALRQHCLLDVSSGRELIESWRTSYFALAFPFSIPRCVSGADFPKKTRGRRNFADAPFLDPLAFARMLATRVEASIRNDWVVVPAARNLATKWKGLFFCYFVFVLTDFTTPTFFFFKKKTSSEI